MTPSSGRRGGTELAGGWVVRYRTGVRFSFLSSIGGLIVVVTASLPSLAFAHGDSGATQLPKNAPAVTKDGEQAKALLAKFEADGVLLTLVKEAVDKAELALARAQGAKLSGDDDGARMLSRVGLELAKQADATVRASDAEKKANDAEKSAADLADEVTRMKTLLAETQARRATIAAELERAKEEAKQTAGDTAKKEQDRIDKKKPAAKPPGGQKH